VLQGERERASDNKSLGRFDLTDIPPAPRGMPQIEVQFDIDANGILNVSAKDKATGKSQNIVIKASSGLTEDEIEKMVADAAAHEEDDRKFREQVDARNQADGLIHASEKTLSELGEKASSEDRHKVESAISDLKAVLKDGDKAAIEAKTAALAEASAAVAQKLYAEQAEQGSEESTAESSGKSGDDVVDAEFEEVDDDKSKSA
jgi:molecular chaperone DnaK